MTVLFNPELSRILTRTERSESEIVIGGNSNNPSASVRYCPNATSLPFELIRDTLTRDRGFRFEITSRTGTSSTTWISTWRLEVPLTLREGNSSFFPEGTPPTMTPLSGSTGFLSKVELLIG